MCLKIDGMSHMRMLSYTISIEYILYTYHSMYVAQTFFSSWLIFLQIFFKQTSASYCLHFTLEHGIHCIITLLPFFTQKKHLIRYRGQQGVTRRVPQFSWLDLWPSCLRILIISARITNTVPITRILSVKKARAGVSMNITWDTYTVV